MVNNKFKRIIRKCYVYCLIFMVSLMLFFSFFVNNAPIVFAEFDARKGLSKYHKDILTSNLSGIKSILLYILLALAVIILIVILVLLFIRKKNTGQKDLNTLKEEVNVEPIVEEIIEEIDEEQEVEIEDDEEEALVVRDEKGNYFSIRFNKSFMAKLIQSSDEIKSYYEELKNEALSYMDVKSIISWHFESFNSGESYLVKFGIRDKTLCVYYPLNALDYSKNKENIKYEDIPSMYRINNHRRLGYVKTLMGLVAEKLGLVKGEEKRGNYRFPFEPNQPLINRGLIKEVRTPATPEQIEKAKKATEIKIVKSVSVEEANEMLSDAKAKTQIIEGESHKTGEKAVINIDTLSEYFNDGDIITLEALKELKLIPQSAGQVKVLARGILNKQLHLELQDYSLEAAKMVIATGGSVKRC